MNQISNKLISLSCEALRMEDSYLRECLSENSSYSSDKNGLLSINNERYYQFVIARHLFCKLPKRIALESNLIDLVVYSDTNPDIYEVAVEMKRWMSSTGNTEIPGIRDDIDKLRKTSAKSGLMLIFSSNPEKVSIDENIEVLSKRIDRNINPEYWKVESFYTVGINGQANKFWVAGYEVQKC